jgi:hypothetical protein
MQYDLSYKQYCLIATLISKKSRKFEIEYHRTLDKLVVAWSKKLGPDKLNVLGFIASRSLKYGKIAEAIPFPAFLDGSANEEGRAFSGLDYCERTLRKIINELVNSDFVHTYFPERVKGIMDRSYRYYEINFKKIQNLTYRHGEIFTLLETSDYPQEQEITKNAPLAKIATRRSQSLLDPNTLLNTTKVVNRITKVIHLGDASPADTSLQPESFKKKRVDQELRMQADRNDLLSYKPTSIKKGDLQKIIDGAMQSYYPKPSRMQISEKSLGFFKKRTLQIDGFDLEDFMGWVIANWDYVSNAHRKAVARRGSAGLIGKESITYIPLLPDFNCLTYRLPYFLRSYENDRHRKSKTDIEDPIAADNKRLRRALQDKKKENESLKNIFGRKIQRAKALEIQSEKPVSFENSRSVKRESAVSFEKALEISIDELAPRWI